MTVESDLDKRPSAGDAIRAVPVIDLGDPSAVDEIADACREWGFFQVINHGVSADLIERVWLQTRAFFALPIDDKESVLRTRENPWGYYNNELTKNQRDKKEVFDYTSDGVDPVYAAENRWPAFDKGFQPTMESYRDACTELSLRILEKMSEGLGLDPKFLNPLFDPQHTGFIRLNFYPVIGSATG